jgi:hypothetical protein
MTVPYWGDDPDAWDYVVLGDFVLPGSQTVTASLGRKLDTRSGAGSDGASIVDKGYQPAKVEITVRLWDRSGLTEWEQVSPLLVARRRQRRALQIKHPSLHLLGVHWVYLEELSALKQTSPGLWEATIKCIEYAPPTPRASTRAAPANIYGPVQDHEVSRAAVAFRNAIEETAARRRPSETNTGP